MSWLAECSAAAVREALRVVAPQLSAYPITVAGLAGKGDPLWWSASAVVGEQFIAKFAWSRPAALRVAREIGILTALGREPAVPFLPEVFASSTDPVLLITRRVPGASLFEVIDSIDRDRADRQLARFLAALHQPQARSWPRPSSASSPARSYRRPRQRSCATGSGRGPGPISAVPSCAGATGPTRRSPRPARPCSCTASARRQPGVGPR